MSLVSLLKLFFFSQGEYYVLDVLCLVTHANCIQETNTIQYFF